MDLLYSRLSRSLMDPLVGTHVLTDFNITACPANCTFPRGSCVNGTCQCEVRYSSKLYNYIYIRAWPHFKALPDTEDGLLLTYYIIIMIIYQL